MEEAAAATRRDKASAELALSFQTSQPVSCRLHVSARRGSVPPRSAAMSL